MSLTCKETFSDIVAVYPIEAEEMAYTVPFNVRTRTYTLAQMGVADMDTLLAKSDYRYSIGEDYTSDTTIEIEERKSTLKSATKETSAGRVYDVTLTLIINENSTKSANFMDSITNKRHDFVVQIANGELLLIRTGECAYTCKAEENFAESYQQKLTISVQNLNGIQRISIPTT